MTPSTYSGTAKRSSFWGGIWATTHMQEKAMSRFTAWGTMRLRPM